MLQDNVSDGESDSMMSLYNQSNNNFKAMMSQMNG
jgi:hypothetical protein